MILDWGKKKIKNAKGKIVKEYYLKKDTKHRIWVKWIDPFQDVLEDDNDLGTDCKWSAEPQSIFEGNMKKMVKEALEKKVVWPWVAPSEDDSNRRKIPKQNPLMANGSFDMPLRQKLILLDNLAVTPMEHHLPPTRKVMMTKTTKYKLVKRQLQRLPL